MQLETLVFDIIIFLLYKRGEFDAEDVENELEYTCY